MTNAWSSGDNLPSGGTSKSPSRDTWHSGQAIRETAMGCLHSGQVAFEIFTGIMNDKQKLYRVKINKIKYGINNINVSRTRTLTQVSGSTPPKTAEWAAELPD